MKWATNGDAPKASWLRKLMHETWFKIVVGPIAAGIIWLVRFVVLSIHGWFASLVHADELHADLQELATMVVEALDPRLSAIEAQLGATRVATDSNSADIRRGRIQNIDAAMRDLRDEIQQMEKDKLNPEAQWTRRDDALLEEWNRDLADLLCERVTLLAPNEEHVECL